MNGRVWSVRSCCADDRRHPARSSPASRSQRGGTGKSRRVSQDAGLVRLEHLAGRGKKKPQIGGGGTARKLLTTIYAILKSGPPYDPTYQSEARPLTPTA